MSGAPSRAERAHGGRAEGGLAKGGLRVLVVDDDEVDRARVLRVLHPEHAAREAATAAESRRLAEGGFDGGPPDVVLLDLRLPDADGTDLLPWFEARGLPVVMLTGVEDTAVVVDAVRRGALDYLTKGELAGPALERALRRATEAAALRRSVAEHRAEVEAHRDRLAAQAAALERANGALEDANGALREKEARVRELARALTLAEQEERQRIAYVLHEDLQQTLAGAAMMASVGAADSLLAALEQAIRTARTLAHELAPPLLGEEGLDGLLRWAADQARDQHGLAVEVSVRGPVTVAEEHVRVLLYQFLRELLFNVSKHAGTGEARVTVEVVSADGDSAEGRGADGTADGTAVRVSVEDEGAGFEPAAPGGPATGFGLASVRERVELVGGRLAVASAPGAGTRVTLTVPLSGATAPAVVPPAAVLPVGSPADRVPADGAL